ncbi:MAG TPA: hypothetical protein VET48_07010, partial [Steroidobacteraceae bacterium]|nr:hypothetical protein [Steroidobacteraceae bacterium]
MNKFTLIRALACIALVLLASHEGLAQTRELSSRGELIDRIVAVVGDGVILKSQLDTETDRITARLRQQ